MTKHDKGNDILVYSSVCSYCRHRRRQKKAHTRKCTAFPDEIPQEIWTGHCTHQDPVEGDNGIQFEFPELTWIEGAFRKSILRETTRRIYVKFWPNKKLCVSKYPLVNEDLEELINTIKSLAGKEAQIIVNNREIVGVRKAPPPQLFESGS